MWTDKCGGQSTCMGSAAPALSGLPMMNASAALLRLFNEVPLLAVRQHGDRRNGLCLGVLGWSDARDMSCVRVAAQTPKRQHSYDNATVQQ